jgi:hypothetical protein
MRNIRSMCDRWPVHHAELSRVRMRTNTSHHCDSVLVVGNPSPIRLRKGCPSPGRKPEFSSSAERTSRFSAR